MILREILVGKGFTQHQFFYRKTDAGFTLIELLIVIGITLILAGASIPIYSNLQVSAQLNDNSSLIIQTLRIARQRSVSRVNNSSHGVFFQINASADDKYILYQGSTYATRDLSYDRVVILDSSLTLSTTLSSAEVNFSKGLGVPNNTGEITLTHDVNGSRIIDMNALGKAEEL